MAEKIKKSEKEWQEMLTMEQYRVLREKWTEPPFMGKLLYNKSKGVYKCAGCGSELFLSESKFESGTGWPSFDAPVEKESVEFEQDNTHGSNRIEVKCPKCGSHLGHVFEDGPTLTKKRYCINSCALKFEEKQ